MPITRLLDWELNHAREWAVSDRPSSATGRASSTAGDAAGCWWETLGTTLVLLSPWWGHLSTSHKSTEWSARYLSKPAAIRFESTGFHATVLHCLACRGTGIKIQTDCVNKRTIPLDVLSPCQYQNLHGTVLRITIPSQSKRQWWIQTCRHQKGTKILTDFPCDLKQYKKHIIIVKCFMLQFQIRQSNAFSKLQKKRNLTYWTSEAENFLICKWIN